MKLEIDFTHWNPVESIRLVWIVNGWEKYHASRTGRPVWGTHEIRVRAQNEARSGTGEEGINVMHPINGTLVSSYTAIFKSYFIYDPHRTIAKF